MKNTSVTVVFVLLAIFCAPSMQAKKEETPATKFAQEGVEASKNKDWTKAIETFRKAADLDKKFKPNLVIAYQHRAFAAASQQKYQDAIADLSEALRVNPQDARTYEQRAAMEMNTKEYDKALADYSQAIKLHPDEISNFLYRGYIYELRGDKKNAMADTESALKLDPTNQKALDRKARLQVAVEPRVPFTPLPRNQPQTMPAGTPRRSN
ncbi:MAG: tetratricopeptide repeat protein [Chthoniobacterales bacterium]